MLEIKLSEPGAIGCDIIMSRDGGLIFMYSTNDGKLFKESFDGGRTMVRQWTVPLGTVTANSNLIRLRDGRLMMPLKNKPQNPRAAELGGADFTVVFSDDEGRTWGDPRPVNGESGCYYLMNGRLLRTHSGRILMPLCRHPEELLDRALETAGWSGCYLSDDEGQTWRPSQWVKGETIDGHLAEPMAVELPGGRLKMFMRTGMGYLYVSDSADGGMSWSPERPTALRMPCAPFAVKADPVSGYLFAVWDNAFPSPVHQYPRSPICLAVSRDGGEEWEFIMELDSNPNHNYGYPSLHFTQDAVLVTYYWNATRRFNAKLNELRLRILDRGELAVSRTLREPLF